MPITENGPDRLDPVTSGRSASRYAPRDLDAARLAAWRAVHDAGDTVVERVSQAMEAASGLSLEWYGVLLHLYEGGEDGTLSQNELDRRSRLSQSGTSRMLAKMERAGLLRRTPSARDRRNLDVVLTEHGRDVFLRATPVHHAAVQEHFGAWLTDEESTFLAGTLQKVLGATEQDGTPPVRDEPDRAVAFGQSVLSLTSDSVIVSDAAVTRDALEPVLLRDASRHITSSAVNELRAVVTRMSTLIEAPEEFLRAGWELHRRLAAFCHNEIVRTVYLELLGIVSSRPDGIVAPVHLEQYLYEQLAVHARLVDAVASGDEQQVASAAHAHHAAGAHARPSAASTGRSGRRDG